MSEDLHALHRLRLRWKLYRRSAKKLRKLRGADVVLVAYAKSGRTWLSVMLSHLVHEKFGTPANELITSSDFRQKYPQVPSFFFTADNFAPPEMAEHELMGLYKTRKLILLVRDPRDVAVSSYFQFTKRASPVARAVYGVPEDVERIPLFDFMCDEGFGLARVIGWLNRWQERLGMIPESLVITYEELRTDTFEALGRVAEFIGLECSEEEIHAAVDFASFEKLKVLESQGFFKSRRMQPRDLKDPNSFKVRRGKISGYRDYFEPAEADLLDEIVAERLSPIFRAPRSTKSGT
jgi:hypothetical protein